MAEASKYKIKLLKIYEYLKQHSDSEHPVTSKEIISMLENDGIHCDRKILYSDIDTLIKNGYDIVCERHRQMTYYLEDSNFDDYELRILLDAIQSAKFITREQTEKLSEKISSLAGDNKGMLLRSTITCMNLLKTENKKIIYNASEILYALENKKKISFKYFDLVYDTNIGVNKFYRKNGNLYKFSPVDLLIDNEKYYVVGYTEGYDDPSVYRLDKMEQVAVLDEISSGRITDGISKLRERTFDMYLGGKTENITIIFENSLTQEIIDKFGYRVPRDKIDENHTSVHIKATVCPTFFAWIFQFGTRVRIMAPQHVMDAYKTYLVKALDQFN